MHNREKEEEEEQEEGQEEGRWMKGTVEEVEEDKVGDQKEAVAWA